MVHVSFNVGSTNHLHCGCCSVETETSIDHLNQKSQEAIPSVSFLLFQECVLVVPNLMERERFIRECCYHSSCQSNNNINQLFTCNFDMIRNAKGKSTTSLHVACIRGQVDDVNKLKLPSILIITRPKHLVLM
jgi:hypothetical protein